MSSGAYCVITNVPTRTLLGEIEGALLPECTQRILAIEVHNDSALVEFESERDADACVGECQLHDSTVQVERHEGGILTPNKPVKRPKAENKADKEKRLNRVGLSYRRVAMRPGARAAPAHTPSCPAIVPGAAAAACPRRATSAH